MQCADGSDISHGIRNWVRGAGGGVGREGHESAIFLLYAFHLSDDLGLGDAIPLHFYGLGMVYISHYISLSLVWFTCARFMT